jgi:hypothetical protein
MSKPNETETEAEEKISTEPIIMCTRDKIWVATIGDVRLAQEFLEAVSGFPGVFELHEVPRHRPLTPIIEESK